MEFIEVCGTYYEVGKQLGEKTRESLHTLLNDFKKQPLYHKIIAYIGTPEGKRVLATFRTTVQAYCSNYEQELRGLADGAGVSFDDLFLFNVDHEFVTILNETPGSSHDVMYTSLYDGCTNISMTTRDGQTLFGHAEDIHPMHVPHGVMVKFVIKCEEGNILEEFVDYYIPGFLSGSKFGFNRHGVVMGHNCIVQEGVNLNGIPRKFMCRALCDVSSAGDAKRRLEESMPGMATSYSFHYVKKTNLGVENTVIETTNFDTRRRYITSYNPTAFYHHCNILQHLEYPCHPEESSVHRTAVISEYVNRGVQTDKHLLYRILSNSQDPNFPVYRTGRSPDYLATAAIGIYDVSKGILEVFTSKPGESQPIHEFKIPLC